MEGFAEWTFEGIPEEEYGMTESIAVTRWHICWYMIRGLI